MARLPEFDTNNLTDRRYSILEPLSGATCRNEHAALQALRGQLSGVTETAEEEAETPEEGPKTVEDFKQRLDKLDRARPIGDGGEKKGRRAKASREKALRQWLQTDGTKELKNNIVVALNAEICVSEVVKGIELLSKSVEEVTTNGNHLDLLLYRQTRQRGDNGEQLVQIFDLITDECKQTGRQGRWDNTVLSLCSRIVRRRIDPLYTSTSDCYAEVGAKRRERIARGLIKVVNRLSETKRGDEWVFFAALRGRIHTTWLVHTLTTNSTMLPNERTL